MSIQPSVSPSPLQPVTPDWLHHLQPARHRVLGLDVGTKTIGLAVTAPTLSGNRWDIVMPIKTVQRGKTWRDDLAALAKTLHDYTLHALVIGLPLNMDGSEGPRAQSTRQMAQNLADANPAWLAAPGLIGFWDERLSTAAVTRFMIDTVDASRRKRAEVVDALAAQHILQGAVDYLNNQTNMHNR